MYNAFATLATTAIFFISLLFPQSFQQSQSKKNQPITLIATGDIMLARKINNTAVSKNDFTSPFADTKGLLSSANITLINLETPLSPNCHLTTEGMTFCADERHLEGIISAGVDIVSLANNHAFDQGEKVFASTSAFLEKSGIKTVYAGHPVKLNIKGRNISFHAFNDIWSWSKKYSKVDTDQMSSEISAAKAGSDLVVIMFHWGNEYTEKITSRQSELAHLAIDSGADLVIGSHPHWIQAAETYKNKIIDYSLGNFIFDQYWSEKTRRGQIAKYTISDPDTITPEYFPVYQLTDGRTVLK